MERDKKDDIVHCAVGESTHNIGMSMRITTNGLSGH
jgi:hypothetical protein